MRRLILRISRSVTKFQFTHPGRGATATSWRSQWATPVSIHAPREGCDELWREGRIIWIEFQFTHPGRGATSSIISIVMSVIGFNSRTPGGVRLQPLSLSALYVCVSIHAPREGCDAISPLVRVFANSFNSRTPGGVRLVVVCRCAEVLCFNSRTPGGVRRSRGRDGGLGSRFNSRTPGGVRLVTNYMESSAQVFQFTHPGRGATRFRRHPHNVRNLFQFTHPGRGATRFTCNIIIV